MEKIYKNRHIVSITLSVFMSVLFVAIAVNAATTIGTNVDTTGTVNASSTIIASSTLQVTGAVTAYGNVTLGDAASDIITITGNASTSQALSTAGDLYVGGYATTTAASGNIATKGALNVTATSTIGLGLILDKPTACVNFYATSTATRGSMVFVTTGATSTYAGTVYWQYGACE